MVPHLYRTLTARIIREGSDEGSTVIADSHFYCYLTCQDATIADLQTALGHIKTHVISHEFTSASLFEDIVLEAFASHCKFSGYSFACIYESSSVLYIVTQNQAEVYIQRGGRVALLLEGDRHAQGALRDDDLFVLTSQASTRSLKVMGGWAAYLEGSDIAGRDVSGMILTTTYEPQSTRTPHVQVKKNSDEVSDKSMHHVTRGPSVASRVRARLMSASRRKILTGAVVCVVVVILLVSIVMGIIQRLHDKRAKQISYVTDMVTQKLQQADDVSFLNSARAGALVADAKQDVVDLKRQVGDDPSITRLGDMIKTRESQIFKEEQIKPEEFYDLGLEDQKATGQLMARDGDRIAIVDPRGVVYLLSISNKSIDQIKTGLSGVKNIAIAGDQVYLYRDDGIYSASQSVSAKKIISQEDNWGALAGIALFNNNLYVLDTGRGSILKFVPVDAGYGAKTSYVKGDAPSLIGTNSIAIDSSVYIANQSTIFKFTAGLQEGYSPQFPQDSYTISQVITSEDVEKVYVWDKPHGSIYIMSKEGSYERQIKSTVLNSASAVVATKSDVYLLRGAKIYRLKVS